MLKLAEKKCLPCDKNIPGLKKEAYSKYLSQIKNWEIIDDKKLVKKFKFKNFAQALEFVNKVGAIAESENHHPNISLYGWNKVKITLWTHAISGLTTNDFTLAAKIDVLLL